MDIITDGAADISTETKNAAQTQLAVVTLEIALTTFWRSIGLEPKTVMGHSLGEYAALYAAGVLSLTDTLYLVGQRARLLLERCERNSYTMLSVSASVDTIRGYLAHIGDSSCAIACINSPNATVLSGTSKDLAQIQENIVSRDANTHTKMLSVPFAYHSCQMDAILNDFKAIASGVTYSPPRIPVASTLFGSLVDKPGIFDEDYLAQQTRHAVDFCGTLSAVKSVFKDPIWLEIGPKPVCTSFIRATLSPSHTKINHTIDANASNWVTISRTLAAAYTSGVDVDWLALHAPYEDDLELLDLPTYAWDMKDYWITHTDKSSALNPTKNQAAVPSELFLTTTAQYLVEKSISPKVKVTFRAGISDHGFVGLIDDHKMQQIGLASEGAFSDAAATVAKYALDYSGRKGVTLAHLTFHDSELLTPLTRDLVGIDGELLTTATMESASAKTILVTFKATSKRGDSYNLGSMRVEYRSPEKAQRNLDRVSFFIKAKMDGLIRLSKEGSGHWIQTDIFYGIIAHVFQISQESRGIKEAFVASDFQEAAGKIVLQPDPKGTRFTSSPYWSGALLHPVGFMLNGNPSKSPQSTFVAMGYDSVEQLANIEPGKEYLTYAHISRWENETAFCNGYVFDPLTSKIVMQAVDLRYQEFKIATWRHILNGPHATGSKHVKSVPQAEKRLQKETRTKILDTQSSAIAAVPIDRIPRKLQDGSESRDSREFAIIIRSLAKATGSDLSEFTDDTLISDVGVDSIMSIEVVAAVKELGVDLPATFLFNYPTIGDLRRAFSRQAASVRDDYYNEQPLGKDNTESLDSREFDVIMSSLAKATGSGLSEFTDDTLITDVGVDSIMSIEVVAAVKELGVDLPATFVFNYPTIGDLRRAFSGSDAILREDDYNEQVLGENESSMCPTPDEVFGATSTPESVSSFSSSPSNFVRIEKNPRVPGLEVKNVASALPPLSARITLLQGRPNTSKTPLYMMADATGTVASYIHLRPFQSKQVVYGVDSPYFRCPSQMISNIDIEHVAKPIVDALIKAQGSGSFLIGGYSAGSLVAFEVSRQLAAAGRSVDGLLLIDMCCPRSLCADRHTLLAEDKFSHDVFEIAANKDSLWSSLSSASRDHFHACFAATNEYTPKPMTPAERPAKTAVIWAERGLVNRVLDDPTIMQNLADRGILTKPYPGFMEDPKLGTFACLIPDKGGMENLGANGWEKFTAGEVLALSVAGDHLELPLPTHVHLLQTQMEKAFTYFSLD
jgi:iterative type I PKS product template protein